MPRRARLRIEGLPLHITHRGHNKAACFFGPADHATYAHMLAEHAAEHECAVHAYVLMTNHVHLLVTPESPENASRLMKVLAQRHTQHINKSRQRSGSLWEGRFRSCIIDSDTYLLRCHRYIELNPVRAAMVKHPSDYPWSSFNANAYGIGSELVTPHPVYEALGSVLRDRLIAYQRLFIDDLPDADVRAIRLATQAGFAVGSESFVERLAEQVGFRPVRVRGQTL